MNHGSRSKKERAAQKTIPEQEKKKETTFSLKSSGTQDYFLKGNVFLRFTLPEHN